MTRLPVAAFVALAVATIAAFFVTQHLKVATPLLAGFPAPHPAAINPLDGQTCKGADHRRTFVSFYLQHRSDDVDVTIVDASLDAVRTLASGVHMRGGNHPVRRKFVWNGRVAGGQVAPDGIYYMKVALIHQGRSVLISNNAGPEPITVETIPPRPVVTSVSPEIIPRAGVPAVTIHYTGNHGVAGRVLVYRTDLPGPPRLVKSFSAHRGSSTPWDGLIQGRPAPQGTYLIGLEVTDKACNTGRFPAELPPAAGTTRGAGLTVRYLAAQPPLTPVAAGTAATVYVDARGHPYHWTLRRAGARARLESGSTRSFALRVRLPRAGAAVYELALRYGTNRTAVPLVARASGAAAARDRVLVVLPALTWQGSNPVDEDRDGLPDTLSAGYPVALERPLVDGLPAGWGDTVGLLTYLRHHHLRYDLTTDLALATGVGPALSRYAGAVLAGDETWVPPRLAAALRGYVSAGGHVLSLGIDSLRRSVTLTATQASGPSGPQSTDIFGARPGPVTPARGALILAGRDAEHIFTGTSGTLRYPLYQPFNGVAAPLTVGSEAGVSPASPAIIAYRLGRGLVVEIGLPGLGSSLAGNFDAQQLMGRVWTVLSARG